jgi:hypothetical protein
MDRAKPLPERDLCIFEDGSDQDREPIALRITGLTLPIELGEDINLGVATSRASDVVVPTTARQISLTGPIVRKGRFELQKCHQLKADHFTFLFADTGRTPEGGLRRRPGSTHPPRCCSARLADRLLIECLDRGALLIIPLALAPPATTTSADLAQHGERTQSVCLCSQQPQRRRRHLQPSSRSQIR